jgi:hypothetical protein
VAMPLAARALSGLDRHDTRTAHRPRALHTHAHFTDTRTSHRYSRFTDTRTEYRHAQRAMRQVAMQRRCAARVRGGGQTLEAGRNFGGGFVCRAACCPCRATAACFQCPALCTSSAARSATRQSHVNGQQPSSSS